MAPVDASLLPSSMNPVTGFIYHYTSSTGLIGLVHERVIWASEASSLNDLAEIRGGWELIDRWASTLPESEPLRSMAATAHKDPGERPPDVFVICCSTSGDDVAQWRTYAAGGSGYAVKLDASIPLAVWSKSPAVSNSAPTSNRPHVASFAHYFSDHGWVTPWFPVIYDADKAFAILDAILSAANDEILKIDATGPGTSDPDEFKEYKDGAYENLGDSFISAISILAHLVKSPGFKGENEVRAIAGVGSYADHLQFRPGPQGVVGYLSATASSAGALYTVIRSRAGQTHPDAPLPIRSVVQGPRLGEENIATVERLLAANGLKGVPIERSELKMR